MTELQLSLFNQLPGCWGCKDKDSIFTYANAAFLQLVGLSDPMECIGRSDFDIPSPSANCAENYQQQDRYVMQTLKPLKVLDIHPYPDGHWRAHIFTKTPWFDSKGELQGTIFYGQDLADTAILEVGHWMCRASTIQSNQKLTPYDTFPVLQQALTPREAEVLFLLLYGKKPQYIAQLMNISIKTFEGYVVKLRRKFHAHSKEQLINIALEMGFGSKIPKTYLKTQLSIVLNSEYAT